MQQVTQLFGIFLIHHEQLVIQHADDTVRGTVNLGDFLRFQSGFDHAVSAGVNNGSRSSGLPEDAGANKFLRHGKILLTNFF